MFLPPFPDLLFLPFSLYVPLAISITAYPTLRSDFWADLSLILLLPSAAVDPTRVGEQRQSLIRQFHNL